MKTEIYTCDRCNAIIPPGMTSITNVERIKFGFGRSYVGSSTLDYDECFYICPKCVIAFKQFMKGK